jgi:hypothetical protein
MHQGQQPSYLGLIGQQPVEHPSQPGRPAGGHRVSGRTNHPAWQVTQALWIADPATAWT